VGSNPSAARNVGILPEDLSLREVLGLLLGEEGKRRLRLRHLTNSQLFEAYDAQLLSKHPSAKGLYEDRRLLKHFRDFLGEFPPTPEMGKQYLAQFSNRKPATLARYSATLKLFFDWYGEPLGMKVKVPRKLPNYVEEDDIDRLIEAIKAKETHKKSGNRDVLSCIPYDIPESRKDASSWSSKASKRNAILVHFSFLFSSHSRSRLRGGNNITPPDALVRD